MTQQNFYNFWFNPQHFKSGNEHQFNLVWLLIFAISLLFLGIGLRDPWPADEPRFAQVAREMVESGQWFFPMRGGELYPDKPPVFMWSIAAFYWLTGSITISFLLPSAICSVITCVLVYDLGRRLWSNQIGWYAAILLLLSVQFVLQAKSAQIDAMVCCWITMGCYGLARHLLLGGNWTWYFIACFFMGLGIITKGVGFLPILMLIPYVLARYFSPLTTSQASQNNNSPEIKGGIKWLIGLLFLFGAIALWFVPMLYLVEASQNPLFEQYRDNILFKQTGERYANSWHHIEPFWYYLVEVIPVFWLPVSILIPFIAKSWIGAIKQGDRRILLLLGWVILVLLFFSMSPGKRGVYVLPALPMLCLLCAPYLTHTLTLKWPKLIAWSLVLLLSLVAFVFGVLGLVEIKATVKLADKYSITPWWYFITLGFIGVAAALFFRKQHKATAWIVVVPCVWLLYSTWGYQLLNDTKTPKNILENVMQLIPENSELAMTGMREQFIYFSPVSFTHFGYHTPSKQEHKAAWHWQGNNENRFVLSFKNGSHACYDISKGIEVGYAHRREWILLAQDSRLANCKQPNEQVNSYTFVPK